MAARGFQKKKTGGLVYYLDLDFTDGMKELLQEYEGRE